MTPRLLALALVFALPASLVTQESFQPIDERVHLVGTQATHAFSLASPEPLFLEYTLTIRAPADAARPTAVITLNGTDAAPIPGATLYAPMRGKVLLPLEPIRAGENHLGVRIDGPAGTTIDLQARLQNYYGIAPDFPRVFIVGDAAVAHASAQRSFATRALRFGAYYAVSVLVLLAFARVLGNRPRESVSAPARDGNRLPRSVLSGAVMLWVALVYGLATPLHIWFSVEATLVVVVAGWALGALVAWIGRHAVGVARWAAVTILSLVLLEVALRVFNAVSPSWVFYSDGYNRYRGRPGAAFYDTRLNSRGFNDVEHAVTKPANVTRRIVAIGDSFAVGVVPYSANFLTLLETATATDGSVDVVNMGVSATDPADYLALLVAEGLAFDPDVVLVGVFIGNDFETPRRKLYEYSYVATLATAAWRLRRAAGHTAAPEGPLVEYQDEKPGLGRDRFLEIEVDRAWVYDTDDDSLPRASARVRQHLRKARDLSSRAGAEFVVVLIPDEAQVDRALQDEVAHAYGKPGRMDFDRPNRTLTADLAADGIRVLDLLPVFRSEGRTARLYKPQDTHWNLAGNRLAAETIAAFLRGK